MAENFPVESSSEKGEDESSNKLSRIQDMIASLFRRNRGADYDITEDSISAKSSIQFVSSSAISAAQTSKKTDDNDE